MPTTVLDPQTITQTLVVACTSHKPSDNKRHGINQVHHHHLNHTPPQPSSTPSEYDGLQIWSVANRVGRGFLHITFVFCVCQPQTCRSRCVCCPVFPCITSLHHAAHHTGHVLVSSKRVVPRFADLTPEEVSDLWCVCGQGPSHQKERTTTTLT